MLLSALPPCALPPSSLTLVAGPRGTKNLSSHIYWSTPHPCSHPMLGAHTSGSAASRGHTPHSAVSRSRTPPSSSTELSPGHHRPAAALHPPDGELGGETHPGRAPGKLSLGSVDLKGSGKHEWAPTVLSAGCPQGLGSRPCAVRSVGERGEGQGAQPPRSGVYCAWRRK